MTQDDSRRVAVRAAYAIAPGVLLVGVAGGIAFPILPAVGIRVGMPLALIGAILAANRIGRILSGPAVGLAADRIGGRRLLVGGLVIQVGVMALYWAGVTTGHPGLFFLLGRALHGPGSACVFVAGQALALHAGGRTHGGLAAGTVRAAMSVGLPLGLVAGGVLSTRLGDAVTFEAAIGAMIAATVLAFWLVPDHRGPLSPARRPSLREELRALADRRMVAIGLLSFAVSFSSMGLVLTTLYLLVDKLGISAVQLGSKDTASALMGWMIVVVGVVTVAASRLGRTPKAHAWIATAGIVALVPGLLVIGLWPTAWGLGVGLSILGVGAGALSSALVALVGEFAVAERRGAAVGWLQLCNDVGGALGPIVGTMLFSTGATVPYLVCAAVVTGFLPAGAWLVRRTGAEPARG